MIASILVALDATEIAPRVLATATEIADRFYAKMYLLRAIGVPAAFSAAAPTQQGDPLPEHLERCAVEDLKALTAGNRRATVEAPIVVFGDPWHSIVEVSDRLNVDLIVMGSHLYHWPDRFLDTVAERVVRRGHRNVLIVR